jgi:carbonic anhydrase
MDFRLQKAIDIWMADKNLPGDCDMISVAGAGKDLAANPEGFVATQVNLSCQLHETKTILLMHHTDCGAYGGHAAFPSREDERAHHLAEMAKAEEVIKGKHPEIEVKKILAVMSDDGSVAIEEV